MLATGTTFEPPPYEASVPKAIRSALASTTGNAGTDWSRLVARVKEGNGNATERLYELFCRTFRHCMWRQLGSQGVEDILHDTFLVVMNAIRRGDLREPDRVIGFGRTVARRQVAAYIEQLVRNRRELSDVEAVGFSLADYGKNPEQVEIARQDGNFLKNALALLSWRDREILVRFYLDEQTKEQICLEMNMTATQFRLTKSRAKEKLGLIGKRRLASDGLLGSLARAGTVAN